MSKIMCLVVSITALLATLSPAAGAVTWHNTGQESFHATTGPYTVTASGGGRLVCTGGTLTGTAPTGTFLASSYSMTGTATFPLCNVTSSLTTDLHCDYTFTGVAWANVTPAVTSGVLDLTCVEKITIANLPICHIGGSTIAHYVNATTSGPWPVGRFTWTTPTQPFTLVASNSSDKSCTSFLGVPTGGTTPVTPSEATFTLTTPGTPGPFLTRTA